MFQLLREKGLRKVTGRLTEMMTKIHFFFLCFFFPWHVCWTATTLHGLLKRFSDALANFQTARVLWAIQMWEQGTHNYFEYQHAEIKSGVFFALSIPLIREAGEKLNNCDGVC